MINKHKSNKIKENSNTVKHLNNGTDHRHLKSCCDQSSPARRTMRWKSVLDYCASVTWSGISYEVFRDSAMFRSLVVQHGCLLKLSNMAFCCSGPTACWGSPTWLLAGVVRHGCLLMPSDECHWTLLMIDQHWFRLWQVITWSNVCPDMHCHLALLGHSELNDLCETWSFLKIKQGTI